MKMEDQSPWEKISKKVKLCRITDNYNKLVREKKMRKMKTPMIMMLWKKMMRKNKNRLMIRTVVNRKISSLRDKSCSRIQLLKRLSKINH